MLLRRRLFTTLILLALPLAGIAVGQTQDDSGDEPDMLLRYPKATGLQDPIARLQQRLDSGEARLEWHERHGYLRSVLHELGIQPSSQILVFSKSSLQSRFISPRTPRAVYFNDEASVGWVNDPGGVEGSVLEITTTDPKWGSIFYTLDQTKTERPRFVRQTDSCINCHGAGWTKNVPGILVRSFFTRADGRPEFGAGMFTITHESPLEKRWGGWYVTGTHGSQRHMGNTFVTGSADDIQIDREVGANRTSLAGLVDTAPYLSPHSDIVALMVLEHQTLVHNLITRLQYLTEDALRDERRMNAFEKRPLAERRPATVRRIESAADPLVRALLFVNEAPLTAPVAGTSAFAKEFAAEQPNPRDARGRSLRDLDLNKRLLRYPCSYLIYSKAFDALPAPARTHVYERIAAVLTGTDKSPDFAHLSGDDRAAIRAILRETRPEYAQIDGVIMKP